MQRRAIGVPARPGSRSPGRRRWGRPVEQAAGWAVQQGDMLRRDALRPQTCRHAEIHVQHKIRLAQMAKGRRKPRCMCLLAVQHPELCAVQGPECGFRYEMIEFMRCDDQPDGSLAVILPQAVSHGAGSKGRARDPGILKAAFEQLGDLMKKSVALLRCPELQALPLPRKDSQGMCCCQSRARLTIAPRGDGSVCSLACRAGRKRRPHSVRRRKGAVSFQEREWSKRWSSSLSFCISSLSRCSCSRWARNSCSSSVRVISSGDVMAVLPAVSA